MKKTFTTFLAIATIVALAVPAAAGKGGKPDKPSKDPLAGTTCIKAGYANLPATSDFTIDLPEPVKRAEACVDVSDVIPGPWTVTVEVTNGTLRSLLVILRDSVAPGDACGAPFYHQGNIQANTEEATFDFTLPGAPGSFVNACGEEWAEEIDGYDYYDKDDTTVESPLAFLVFAQGRDLAMTLDVDLPPLDPPYDNDNRALMPTLPPMVRGVRRRVGSRTPPSWSLPGWSGRSRRCRARTG